MMKKALSILALSALSGLAPATPQHGDHSTHGMMHGMSGQHMSSMGHSAMIGQPGDPSRITRTIEIDMDDRMRFTPSKIQVEKGETIRFAIRNSGKLPHEMVIGTLDELLAHAEEMRNMPHAGPHDEPNMLTLEAGGQGDLLWHFDQTGTVDFACLIPGHHEAGMAGRILVE